MSRTVSLFAAVALAATTGATAVRAAGASDADFLKKAIQGDNSEIALGQLAEQKGASSGVRDFGRMLHDDHANAKSKALPVAQAHGLSDNQDMAPEAKAEMTKLNGMSGQAFDREFARYMVNDHKKDIAEFRQESMHGDASTARLAKDTLPDLEKHLRTAEGLQKS
jgi:putative membrane protein